MQSFSVNKPVLFKGLIHRKSDPFNGFSSVYLELIKFMAGLALKLGEARGDLPGVNLRTGIPTINIMALLTSEKDRDHTTIQIRKAELLHLEQKKHCSIFRNMYVV